MVTVFPTSASALCWNSTGILGWYIPELLGAGRGGGGGGGVVTRLLLRGLLASLGLLVSLA